MPATTDHPGGAGEFGCGVTQAAVACAYAGREVGCPQGAAALVLARSRPCRPGPDDPRAGRPAGRARTGEGPQVALMVFFVLVAALCVELAAHAAR